MPFTYKALGFVKTQRNPHESNLQKKIDSPKEYSLFTNIWKVLIADCPSKDGPWVVKFFTCKLNCKLAINVINQCETYCTEKILPLTWKEAGEWISFASRMVIKRSITFLFLDKPTQWGKLFNHPRSLVEQKRKWLGGLSHKWLQTTWILENQWQGAEVA